MEENSERGRGKEECHCYYFMGFRTPKKGYKGDWGKLGWNWVLVEGSHLAEILDQENKPKWTAIGIYGWPESSNKHKTLVLMNRLKEQCTTPCIMFGDFNEVVSMAEKEGGDVRKESQMDAFRGAINDCNLRDLGYRGSCFTWQRGSQPNTFMRERLYRFLADEEWCNIFPFFEVFHFPIYKSDHAPIILPASSSNNKGKQEKMFKFKALWLSKDECQDVIEKVWNDSMSRPIREKLSMCAAELTEWASSTFGNIKRRIKEAERELKAIGEKLSMCAAELTEWASSTFGNIKRRIKEAERELKWSH
ncbi:Unconventional myosin-XVI [Bienertia sinuspersici]